MIAATALLYSCGSQTPKQEESQASVEDFSAIAESVSDGHNAQNSLDYQGTYTGTFPTASGPGMLVTITLSDSTYARTLEYIGKKNSKIEDKGKYTWSKNGSVITLENVNKEFSNQYFVGENTLTQLDMEGNKITGDMADLYILKK